jgi:iron complex transport system substrate-binding protein
MKRFCLSVLIVTTCVLAATAASRKPAASLKDDFGETVTLEKYPRRIVSLAPSCTEYLFAAGLGDRVVGVTSYCKYPPQAQKKPVLGDYANTNVEKILLAKPDLVLAAYGNQAATLDRLRQAGVPLFGFNPKTLEETLNAVIRTGKLGGTERVARAFVTSLRKRLDRVRQRTRSLPPTKRPRVFYSPDMGPPIYTAGGASIVDECIRIAGGVNVAHDLTQAYPTFSAEVLIKQDPDVVILSDHRYKEVSQEKLLKILRGDTTWGALSAVKRGRVYFVPVDRLGNPNTRIVDGIERLAKALHPELFGK